MLEEDFYATIKLITGEEIFAKVSSTNEEGSQLLVSNPVVITPLFSKNGSSGYKVEPWLKTASDDMFLIGIERVITISESSDMQMILMYNSFLRDMRNETQTKISRKMGYIADINEAKNLLENLYKNS
jgi:hypothetical protein